MLFKWSDVVKRQKKRKIVTLTLVVLFLCGLLLTVWPIASELISYKTDEDEYESIAAEYHPPESTPVPLSSTQPEIQGTEEQAVKLEKGSTSTSVPLIATPVPVVPDVEGEVSPIAEIPVSPTPSEMPQKMSTPTNIPVSLNPVLTQEPMPTKASTTAAVSSPTAIAAGSNTSTPPAVPFHTFLPATSMPTATMQAWTKQPTAIPFRPTATAAPQAGIDFSACLAQNKDFVAWLTIPGTQIDYPVVRSNDTEFYLHHMFSGKESQLGCLFSLKSSDYQAPSRNIAIYGHHLSQSDAMFSTLLRYKDPSYCASHSMIRLDSLYGYREYRVFAVVNMLVTDWDAATASFSGDVAFMRFVDRARQKALFETGVRVEADDHILTLITCDRGFGGVSGRLVVMAVQQ